MLNCYRLKSPTFSLIYFAYKSRFDSGGSFAMFRREGKCHTACLPKPKASMSRAADHVFAHFPGCLQRNCFHIITLARASVTRLARSDHGRDPLDSIMYHLFVL